MNTFTINKVLALVRDEYKCRGCGASGTELHAHHIKPLRDGGSDELDNLISLCQRCHSNVEGVTPVSATDRQQVRTRQNIYLTKEMYDKIITVSELYTVKPRKSKVTHQYVPNISLTIDVALDAAIEAARKAKAATR